MSKNLHLTDDEKRERAKASHQRWLDRNPGYASRYYHRAMLTPEYKAKEYVRTHTAKFRAAVAEAHRVYTQDPVVKARIAEYQRKYRAEHKERRLELIATGRYAEQRTAYIRSHPEFWGNHWACVSEETQREVMAELGMDIYGVDL